MMSYRAILMSLGVAALLTNSLYVHRVPGLMGDEASEGQNVWRLLNSSQITVLGERSYIGPLIDYIRVPFVAIFGYSPIALRLPMLLATVLTFICAARVVPRLFGPTASLFALSALFFSPIYFSQQRLGWTITLFPLSAVALLYFLTTPKPTAHTPLLAGIMAGLSLSNHIIFAPTLIAIVAVWIITQLKHPLRLVRWWPALIGFWAGFGMQFTILHLVSDDQGNPAAVADLFADRLRALPGLVPHILSGSSYIARYTGQSFSLPVMWTVCAVIAASILCALFLSSHRRSAWAWLVGVSIQLSVLLVMIDRFSLRYFVIPVLAVWLLAGVGAGAVIEKIFVRRPHVVPVFALGLAGCLALVTNLTLLKPYLASGGSLQSFSLGNRTDTAAALVDTRPLVACLQGAGPVFSENVHVLNRLEYLVHDHSGFVIASDLATARWQVNYRQTDNETFTTERCGQLRHFAVTPASS